MEEKTHVVRGVLIPVLFFTVCTFFVVPVSAAEEKVSERRATARALIDAPLQQLAEHAGAYEAYRDMVADFLPEDSVTVLDEVLFIAQLDISPEEKGDALIETAQSSCLAYVQLWVIGLILHDFSFLGTLASLLRDIGALGVLLCLFGIL